MSSTRSPQRFSASGSLRRLRTAFSASTSSFVPNAPLSPVSEGYAVSCTSDAPSLSPSSTCNRFSFMASSMSSNSLSIKSAMRRSPSLMELELEEERGPGLDLVEPRPALGCAAAGFEEVLFGRL